VTPVSESPRFREALNLLKRYNIKVHTLLDLGCGDGSLTIEVAKAVEAKEIYCIDIDARALSVAGAHGAKTFLLDLSKDKIPLPDNSVDLATSFEVIEKRFIGFSNLMVTYLYQRQT
jgi:ubiquinone/menaquinone biosynthesis C-methylase UbiE